MPAKIQQKSKAAKMAAATASRGGKKKKWSKGKQRDQAKNLVLFDEDTWARMEKEVPKMKMITAATMSERLKINLSLARAAIKHMEEKGEIRPILKCSKQLIYTRASNA